MTGAGIAVIEAGSDPEVDQVSEPAPAGRSPTCASRQGNLDDQDGKRSRGSTSITALGNPAQVTQTRTAAPSLTRMYKQAGHFPIR
jgi:hypothetical protein